MKWIKYTIHTTEEAEDLIAAALYENGITSIEIEDKRPATEEENAGYFGDVLPDMPEDDGLADISFYTEEDVDAEELIARLGAAFADLRSYADIGEASIRLSETQDLDWINNWKQYFHKFTVDDITIIPSWEEEELEGDETMVLRIDPGTAFGTGKHDTTQLAIRGLRKYVREGDRLLDIGTGSGILGIIALKSGASFVFGTDIDTNTLPAISDNFEKNAIDPATFPVVIGNLVDDEETNQAAEEAAKAFSGREGDDGLYDICTANIIAEILVDIAPAAARHLKKGGYFITSGIITGHEEIVREAFARCGLEIVEEVTMGEWMSIVGRLS